MTEKEMREAWTDTLARIERLERLVSSPAGSGLLPGKTRTSLDNLSHRYLMFSRVSFIMIFLAPVWLGLSFTDFDAVTLFVAFMGYFAIASVMDYWLYMGIKSIDPIGMSVADVARKARYYKKWHIIFMCVLIPLAVTLILYLCHVMKADSYFIYGVLSGVVIGLAIGTRQFIKFMADYRSLQ